jgi:hypothetical protein
MKVNVIIEVRDQGTVGVSMIGTEVGPNYSEDQIAERAKKQFIAAMADLRRRISIRNAERDKQPALFTL